MRVPLSADTSPEIEQMQIERWRAMCPEEKVAIVVGLTQAVFELARVGRARRYPDASASELFLRGAIELLGPDLALRAYPEAARLLQQ